MLTENGSSIDQEDLNKILREADVLTIGFTFTRERLLIDTRTTDTVGPLVTPVGPVSSIQERFTWLGKHRPTLGSPEGFSFSVWPQAISTMVETRALAILEERLRTADPGAADALAESIQIFAASETEASRTAVLGVSPWTTIWSREGEQEEAL